MVDQVTLNLKSRGTLDRTATSLEGKVKAEHYDGAKNFLSSLDADATVRIVNGRSKNRDLVLSTKSNSGNFYSRKPVTKEFFKQACIGRFGDVSPAAAARAFEEEYGKVGNGAAMHSARHFLAVMEALEKKFAAPPASRSEAQKPSSVSIPAGGSDGEAKLKAFNDEFDNFFFDQALQAPGYGPSEGRLSTFSDRFRDDASFLEELRRTRKSLPGSVQSERFSLNEAAKRKPREEEDDARYSVGNEERFKSFDEKEVVARENRGSEPDSDDGFGDDYEEAFRRHAWGAGSVVSGSDDLRSSDASDKSA